MKQPRLHPCLKVLFGDLSALLGMASVAACCGFAANAFRETPLPLAYVSKAERVRQAAGRIAETSGEAADVSEAQPDSGTTDTPYAHPIDLASFRALQKRALILDARPEIFHRLGHIPKAISLPREDFEACYRKQRALLEKHKAHPVVIYCSGTSCEDAAMVADALVRLGFTDLYLFQGGWQEWTQAKLPEEKNL